MKKIFRLRSLFIVSVLLFQVSCTKDFTELNENPNSATFAPATNVFASGINTVTNNLFGLRLDGYYAGSYSGMLAYIIQGDYEYRVDINNSIWASQYMAMARFVDAMRIAEADGNTNLKAAALTLKAYTAQKTTDMFGDIPYSEAFQADDAVIYPKYDSQEDIYHAILDELKTAADLFNSGTGNIGVGDFIFSGDVNKWKKFCNSIRLRVAIRMSNVDPDEAKAVIAEVLGNPANYPVMEDNDDNAYFHYNGVSPYEEPWFKGIGGRVLGGYRVNDVLVTALKNNNDPRLPVYAIPNKWGVYNGFRFYFGQMADTLNNSNNVSLIGDRFANDPSGFSPFMNCAEVYFIKAEAYERGFLTGDAEEAYLTGITKSLEENGITGNPVSTFLSQPEVAWNGGSTTNLEKIALQKWISLYKQSVEAWSEARRTDIPLMTNISENYANKHNRPPFRMAYADEERTLNSKNFPTYVNSVDIFWGDQLWWDTRTGVH
jgi:hypothetical protein